MIRHRAQPSPCPFCEIVAGRAPARILVEGERAIAFLDTAPVRPGHTLVIPRQHVEDLTSDDAAAAIAAMADPLAAAARLLVERLGAKGLTCIQANGGTAGQEISHLHVHLVPRTDGDGRLTTWTRDPQARLRLGEVYWRLTSG